MDSSTMARSAENTSTETNADKNRTLHIVAAIGMVIGALLTGACAKNASSGWAQTAPVIKSELSGVDAVSLGVRPG